MKQPADEITRAIANAKAKFQTVEDQTYEIALALFLDGFTRADIETELRDHSGKLAAQVEASDAVHSAWKQLMRDVIVRAVERAEQEAKKRKAQ